MALLINSHTRGKHAAALLCTAAAVVCLSCISAEEKDAMKTALNPLNKVNELAFGGLNSSMSALTTAMVGQADLTPFLKEDGTYLRIPPYFLQTPELAQAALGQLSKPQFRQVRSLRLSGGRAGDACFGMLRGIPVEHLYADQTLISDQGIALLQGADVVELDLFGTGVTDKAVPYLASLKRLQDVNVKRTKITQSGVKALLAARPGLRVHACNDGECE